jgi:hypothetical protein
MPVSQIHPKDLCYTCSFIAVELHAALYLEVFCLIVAMVKLAKEQP